MSLLFLFVCCLTLQKTYQEKFWSIHIVYFYITFIQTASPTFFFNYCINNLFNMNPWEEKLTNCFTCRSIISCLSRQVSVRTSCNVEHTICCLDKGPFPEDKTCFFCLFVCVCVDASAHAPDRRGS